MFQCRDKILVSCEHGGNQIPRAYRHMFRPHARILGTHLGYDPGAYELYQLFAKCFADAAFASKTSRLFIDLNRSEHHPKLFSSITKRLPPHDRKKIMDRYYRPYRGAVEERILKWYRNRDRIWHFSIHTFTPKRNGVLRQVDIGLLYDPQRMGEKIFCAKGKVLLQKLDPRLRVRHNAPYRGQADGLTSYLRKQFGASQYRGIELEVNQKFYRQGPRRFRQIGETLSQVVKEVLDEGSREYGEK